MRRFSLAVFFVLTISLRTVAEHSPLLPRVQEIQYGTGQFQLTGAGIVLRSPATPEEKFAVEQLSSTLSKKTARSVQLVDGNSSGNIIELNRTGTAADLTEPGERSGRDSPEAYSINITSSRAEVRAGSSRGLFYAVQTLAQLVEGEGPAAILPIVEIHDWPSLPYRGAMIDMSHGPLPTEGEIERQIDFLSRFKANQYYFYNEASIELKRYPLLNPTGRFTQDEIRRIVDYGRQRHVDIIPCLELYGHLHDLFRVEKYADLSDVPHGTWKNTPIFRTFRTEPNSTRATRS